MFAVIPSFVKVFSVKGAETGIDSENGPDKCSSEESIPGGAGYCRLIYGKPSSTLLIIFSIAL
jgi:hypothetical protein